MLEHQKIVLNGVQFDKRLFKKELIKSLVWLPPNEQIQLRKWVKEHFYHSHADVINDVFHPKLENAC